MNHKKPDLNIRYAVGIGDFVACTLHSKPFNWFTRIITKRDSSCTSCSNRRQALNVLFPIKFWKLFFKNEITYLENLTNFYKKCGYNASLDYDNGYVTVSKFGKVPDYPNPEEIEIKNKDEIIQSENEIIELESKPIQPKNDILDDYMFLSSNEISLGDYLIKTEYYKKNKIWK
jgi:hypothetical protein